MTWEDVQIFTLQKMFELQGDVLEQSDATTPYILSMPHVANEGLQRLATVGRFVLRPYEIVQPGTEAGMLRYDLAGLTDDFFQFDEQEIYFEGSGRYGRTSDFSIEAESTLVLPGAKAGLWRVYYRAYPREITKETPKDYELALHPEMAVLLPLYMASQLYKDDDVGMATGWRNEFEIGLTALIEANRSKQYGREEIENTSGWW